MSARLSTIASIKNLYKSSFISTVLSMTLDINRQQYIKKEHLQGLLACFGSSFNNLVSLILTVVFCQITLIFKGNKTSQLAYLVQHNLPYPVTKFDGSTSEPKGG